MRWIVVVELLFLDLMVIKPLVVVHQPYFLVVVVRQKSLVVGRLWLEEE